MSEQANQPDIPTPSLFPFNSELYDGWVNCNLFLDPPQQLSYAEWLRAELEIGLDNVLTGEIEFEGWADHARSIRDEQANLNRLARG